jgi:hypothetical protein
MRPVLAGKLYEPGPGANVFLITVSFFYVPNVPAILILGSIYESICASYSPGPGTIYALPIPKSLRTLVPIK